MRPVRPSPLPPPPPPRPMGLATAPAHQRDHAIAKLCDDLSHLARLAIFILEDRYTETKGDARG